MSLSLPQFERYRGLGDQIRRCSRSICANIAEGLSKISSEAEEKRFLGIALGSCEETRVWLHYAFKFGYINEDFCRKWRKEYSEIARMVYSLYEKRMQKRGKAA